MPFHSKLILLVHRDDAILSSIGADFVLRGARVSYAKNAISALSRFQLERPDMVFISRYLPIITGDSAIRKMQLYSESLNHSADYFLLLQPEDQHGPTEEIVPFTHSIRCDPCDLRSIELGFHSISS